VCMCVCMCMCVCVRVHVCVCVRPIVCTPFDEVSLWFDTVEFLLVSAWQVSFRSIWILGRLLVLSASLAR
jgi:hypothetical protein